jgi:DNA repair protein RadC
MRENTVSLESKNFPPMKNIIKPSTPIKDWPADDRPREKMILKGPAALSNSELIAILINNGNKERSAVSIAMDVLKLGKDNLGELGKLSINDLQKIKGIGEAKAISISAALELGRRRLSLSSPEKMVVKGSKEIAEYLKLTLQDHNHEVFAIIFLNRANKIKHFEIISKGGITGTVADPRIILKKAIEAEATSIVLSHNHPSGNLRPSRADEEITQKIKQAAEFFDIRVLDHIIVSEEGYFSFADEGMI